MAAQQDSSPEPRAFTSFFCPFFFFFLRISLDSLFNSSFFADHGKIYIIYKLTSSAASTSPSLCGRIAARTPSAGQTCLYAAPSFMNGPSLLPCRYEMKIIVVSLKPNLLRSELYNPTVKRYDSPA